MIGLVLFILGWVAFTAAGLIALSEEVTGRRLGLDGECYRDISIIVGLGLYVEAAIFAVAGL